MPPLPTLLFFTGGAALLGWLLVLAGVMVATRPRQVHPDPPTDICNSSRPAVVNLLTNSWRCTLDAARATLVDLVARGYLGIRTDGPDPAQTVIEIWDGDPPSLTRYERRMISRLWSLSQDGEVPLPALTFRTRRAASRWLTRFTSEVAADARSRDVARAGINTDFLSATALVPALALGGWTYLTMPSDPLFSAVAMCVALLLALHFLAAPVRERHRPSSAGRAVAAHWLGVRAYLRERQPGLADLTLPQIRDRRAGYAVALGVATTISQALQFAPVHDRRVVTPHRVLRVRFPDRMRFCWGWGGLGCATAAATALSGAVLFGATLTWYGDRFPIPVAIAGGVLTMALAVTCVGLAGLAVADVAGTREHTGTVVLLEGYGHDSARDPRLESRYVLALGHSDNHPGDGHHDAAPVPAWILPNYLGDGLSVGCTVTVRVRRWTGLVAQLAIVRAPTSTTARPTAENRCGPAPDTPATNPSAESDDGVPVESHKPTEGTAAAT